MPTHPSKGLARVHGVAERIDVADVTTAKTKD
jgi:hypothetical protein